MLQQNSLAKVVDNSGYNFVKVIRVYGKRKRREAEIGNIVLVSSTKKSAPNLPKGKMMKALVVATKSIYNRRSDGTFFRFPENCVLIVNREKSLLEIQGSRVRHPILSELTGLFTKKSRSKISKVI